VCEANMCERTTPGAHLLAPETSERVAEAQAVAHTVAHAAPASPAVVRPAESVAEAPQPSLLHGRVVDQDLADEVHGRRVHLHRVVLGDRVEEADELGVAGLVDDADAVVDVVGAVVEREVGRGDVRGVVEAARVQRVRVRVDGRVHGEHGAELADAEEVVDGRGEVGHRGALDATRAERARERLRAGHVDALGRVGDAGHLHGRAQREQRQD